MRSDASLVDEGRRVLLTEAEAVRALAPRLGTRFVDACRMVAEAPGRVVLSGIGKSGHIARKIAGTLTSTGTPATFMHAVEALHGDLGIVGSGDVAILVSRSGRGSEIGGLIGYLGRLGTPIIGLTGDADGDLARNADVVLDCAVDREACPMDLTPTSSTTAALAMGDALAMVVLQLKGFESDDFAALHPGGALGLKLTVRVSDIMIGVGYPWLPDDATMRDAIVPLAEMRGTVPIVDGDHRLVGIVTTGDLTRLMERDDTFLQRSVAQVMTRTPKTAAPDELGAVAIRRMEDHGIMALPVVTDGHDLVGVVHLHDLMRSGAV
ncbi:MAG: KpsF/GutQ family sugar-phosphate isomerase [Gemmatimonadota bacterium]|nr:KpsF/GutQ family sugar-phosphate isomerase [Gemmatimonadota bacterium]